MLTKPQTSDPSTLPRVRTSVYVPLSSSGSCAVYFLVCNTNSQPRHTDIMKQTLKTKNNENKTRDYQTIRSLFWYEHVTNNDTEACDWTG